MANLKSFFSFCRVCRIISTCCIGSFQVLGIVYFKRLLSKSYQAALNNNIRKRAKKIMKLTRSQYKLTLSSSSSSISHGQKQNSPLQFAQPIIYMSNHLSLLDIPLIYALMPGKITFLAKESLFKFPVFGKAIRTCGIIPTSQKNLYDTVHHLLEYSDKTLALWIFPEGHRSLDGNLLDFKAGGFALAKALKAKIIPVGIRGTQQILPAKTLNLNPDPTLLAELHMGEEIDCRDFQRPEQTKTLMHMVRSEIQKLSTHNLTTGELS